MKAEIEEQQSVINKTSLIISRKKEWRDVRCEWRYNYTRGVKSLYRNDTGEFVEEDIISEHERVEQQNLLNQQEKRGEKNQKEDRLESEAENNAGDIILSFPALPAPTGYVNDQNSEIVDAEVVEIKTAKKAKINKNKKGKKEEKTDNVDTGDEAVFEETDFPQTDECEPIGF